MKPADVIKLIQDKEVRYADLRFDAQRRRFLCGGGRGCDQPKRVYEDRQPRDLSATTCGLHGLPLNPMSLPSRSSDPHHDLVGQLAADS